MSLLSTILAFALVPLVKRNEEKEKEQIAFLEAELASYKEANKTLGARLTAAERDVSILNTTLAVERERGVQDREQTRHWRQQADYWQQAFTARAVPNQYSQEAQARLQNGPMEGQHLQQWQQYQQWSQAAQNLGQGLSQLGAQHLAAQQLGAQQLWERAQNRWLDCTCVPGRAEALMRGATADEAVRVVSSETIREQARRLMAAPFRSAIGA